MSLGEEYAKLQATRYFLMSLQFESSQVALRVVDYGGGIC